MPLAREEVVEFVCETFEIAQLLFAMGMVGKFVRL